MSKPFPPIRRAVVILATAVALAAGLAPAAPARAATDAAAGSLTWRACGQAQCATLPVPLDDAVTGVIAGPTVDLALIRYPARDQAHRIGSLVVNPGGPGASGFDFVRDATTGFPDEVRDRFDVVGFDPRGSGRSDPVRCDNRLDGYYSLDFAPDTEAERTALVAGVQKLVDDCEAKSGPLLPYLSTARTVRDLDRIRAALGDEKLTYLGFSYGSYLGTLYAEQFPTRVRALVLDGALDPALDASDQQVEQAVGFERSLDQFLASCARDDGCAFHGGGRSARAYDRLRDRVDAQPIAGRGSDRGRALGPTLFDLAVTQALYGGRSEWPSLAEALDDAGRGDPTAMFAYADSYTGRRPDGRYDSIDDAFFAIGCPDGPPMGGLAGIRAIEDRAAAAAPRLGASIINNSLACALWPVQPSEPAAAITAPGTPPILVVGTRRDPATPLKWAQGLARELDQGVLLTAGGSRHTAFAAGNSCIDDAVVTYLVDLDPPRNGTSC